MTSQFLIAKCSATEAEKLKNNIGKAVVVEGKQCVIVNVVRIKNEDNYTVTVRKL